MSSCETKTAEPEGRIWRPRESSDKLIKFAEKWPSAGHFFLHVLAHEHAEKIVMTDHESGRQWTGAQLHDKILNVACALVDLHGFQQGDHLCISYNNSDLCAILILAAIVAGGMASAHYIKDHYEELLYLATFAPPKLLFCRAGDLSWADSLSRDLGQKVSGVPMEYDSFKRLLDYDYSESCARPALPPVCRDKKREIVVLTLSSGTTGKPKLVGQSHWNCLVGTMQFLPGQLGKAMGVVFSINYASGRFYLFRCIAEGIHAVMMEGLQPSTYLKVAQEYKFETIPLGTATMYQLITHPDLDKYDLSSVTSLQLFGAKLLYVDELKRFLDRHPHITHVRQRYASSEMGFVSMTEPLPVEQFLQTPDLCGHLKASYQVKLVNPENGEPVTKPNESGILFAKGEALFPGYYDVSKPDKLLCDETVFDADGFFNPGDICFFDEDERLHYVGRHKETILCRDMGKRQPHEFEEIFLRHPAVLGVSVMGIPNKREAMEFPRAFVTIKPDYQLERDEHDEVLATYPSDVSADGEPLVFKGRNTLCKQLPDDLRRRLMREILHFANSHLSYYYQMDGGICVLDELPTLRSSGKLDKLKMRDLTVDQVEIYGDLTERFE